MGTFVKVAKTRDLAEEGMLAGPVGSGRRMATSTGPTSLPSAMTTPTSTPSMPGRTRFSGPLPPVPTRPHGWPYFLKTAASTTHVHCQRLRVVALEALVGVATTALSGVGLAFLIRFGPGHDVCLHTVGALLRVWRHPWPRRHASSTMFMTLHAQTRIDGRLEVNTEKSVQIALPIAVIAVIVVGVRLLIAAVSGETGKITESKRMLRWVLIGTAVVIGSSALAKAIISFLENLDS